MYTLQCQVLFGNIENPTQELTSVNNIVIEESQYTDFVNKATIKVPYLEKRFIKNLKKGDRVQIKLGYLNKYFDIEFLGYISDIEPNTPAVIYCEDNMYLFRQVNLKKSFRQITLKELVNYILGEVNDQHKTSFQITGDIPEINFSKYRLPNLTAYQALVQLKEDYGINSFLKKDKFYCTLGFLIDFGEVKYSTRVNIISNDFKKVRAEDTRIKLVAQSINRNNTQLKVQVGDTDGALRSLILYNIGSKEELENIATNSLKNFKYDGVDGSLETFLIPFAESGMSARIQDERLGIDDSYLIKFVKTTFGVQGARRSVEIGYKLSV